MAVSIGPGAGAISILISSFIMRNNEPRRPVYLPVLRRLLASLLKYAQKQSSLMVRCLGGAVHEYRAEDALEYVGPGQPAHVRGNLFRADPRGRIGQKVG